MIFSVIKGRKRRNKGFGKLWLVCLALVLALAVCGVGYAHWSEMLYIEGTVSTGEWDLGGTRGFWSAWNNHKTYTEDEIEGWLESIDDDSLWLVPDMDEDGDIDVTDLDAVFDQGTGKNATMQDKFLAHYLATRLDAESGRLHLHLTHDVSTYDPDNYLGLTNAESATLSEIVAAIESKYPDDPTGPADPSDAEAAWPTHDEYEIMKSISDALNKVEA